MKNKSFIAVCTVLWLCLLIASSWGQGGRLIEGYIKDAKTGEPLPGANVFIVNTTMGAVTNMDGKYVIRNVPLGSHTLRVSYIGYKRADYSFQMKEDIHIHKDFQLEYIGITGKSITVTAQAIGQVQAIQQ